MIEYLSRKYNYVYFILMILISLPFIGMATIIVLINIDEIISERRISSILFVLFYISIFIFFIRFSYVMNAIIYDSSSNKIIIKKIFSKKYVDFNEVEGVGRYILPYLNYIKIDGKNYLFISRTIDIFGDNFNLNFEKDLDYIKELIEENKDSSPIDPTVKIQ